MKSLYGFSPILYLKYQKTHQSLFSSDFHLFTGSVFTFETKRCIDLARIYLFYTFTSCIEHMK